MKTLKIAFAMGGGVSLGSFSGAALTESLKLLLLYGQDIEGHPYESIEVDAMSGASAGAISLAILIRTLIDYESMLDLLELGDRTEAKHSLEVDFKNTYGIEDSNSEQFEKYKKFKDQFLALETAQRIQYQCWVEGKDGNKDTVNFATKLFGRKTNKYYKGKIRNSYGLLDRQLLENLARKYLNHPIEKINPMVLSNHRALYACSLTNLTPFTKYETVHTSKLLKFTLADGLIAATRSSDHKDLRVFDFQFNDLYKSISDSRWIKLNGDDTAHDKGVYNLKDNDSWNTVAATAIACGAFPIAFEPVLLKRFKFEYAESEWPRAFNEFCEKDYKNNIGFIDANSYLDYSSFNFPYVDGGTFNNEPIKEAFKLANFIDRQNENNSYDRIVIFIDPIVPKLEKSYNRNSYKPIVTGRKFEKGVSIKNESSKLVNYASALISMLRNQSTVKEENKINRYFKSRDLFNIVAGYYEGAEIELNRATLDVIRKTIEEIELFLSKSLIPPGPRNIDKFLKKEVEKHFKSSNFLSRLELNNLHFILQKLRDEENFHYIQKDIEREVNFSISDKEMNDLVKLFFIILSDITIGSAGKDHNAMRIAILPVDDRHKIIDLLGSELFGFGGFSSEWSRVYSFKNGLKNTFSCLNSRDFLESFHFSKGNFEVKSLLRPLHYPLYMKEKSDSESELTKRLGEYKNDIEKHVLLNGYKRALKSFLPSLGVRLLGAVFLLIPSLFSRIVRSRLIRPLAEDQIFELNKPLLVSIISKVRLSRKVILQLVGGKNIHLKMEKAWRGEDSKYNYFFYIYLKIQGEDRFTFVAKKRSNLKRMLPFKSQDSDKDMKRINKITFVDTCITNIPDIDDSHGTLHWYLSHIDYHVNPMLEIDVDDGFNSWYFKEGTLSYDIELSNKQKNAREN